MAESLDTQIDLAEVYAQALFEVAQERGKIADVRGDLDELAQAVSQTPDLASFLVSVALDPDQRASQLEKWFRGKLGDEVLNTLLVMNRNGRHGLLAGLRRAYVLRQEAAAGEVEAIAISAVALSDAERKAVEETVAKITGQSPLVEFVVDTEILGGLVLRIGDMVYDNSVRSQLRESRKRLAARGERGLALSS